MITDKKFDKTAHFITEISEEDFRKLDLKGYEIVWLEEDEGKPIKSKRWFWKEVNLNDILDSNIAYWMEQGYEKDFEDLKFPVTIAIHTNNGPSPTDYYFDKFMNQYSGPKTYEIAMGLHHIYSTRDYFEAKDDYWRVLKRETKAIYRVYLDVKYLKEFKFKHKTEISYIFNDQKSDFVHHIERNYDLIEAEDSTDSKWELKSIVEVRIWNDTSSYIPITEEKEAELKENDPEPKICHSPNTERGK